MRQSNTVGHLGEMLSPQLRPEGQGKDDPLRTGGFNTRRGPTAEEQWNASPEKANLDAMVKAGRIRAREIYRRKLREYNLRNWLERTKRDEERKEALLKRVKDSSEENPVKLTSVERDQLRSLLGKHTYLPDYAKITVKTPLRPPSPFTGVGESFAGPLQEPTGMMGASIGEILEKRKRARTGVR
jgi:hypothetical protein